MSNTIVNKSHLSPEKLREPLSNGLQRILQVFLAIRASQMAYNRHRAPISEECLYSRETRTNAEIIGYLTIIGQRNIIIRAQENVFVCERYVRHRFFEEMSTSHTTYGITSWGTETTRSYELLWYLFPRPYRVEDRSR